MSIEFDKWYSVFFTSKDSRVESAYVNGDVVDVSEHDRVLSPIEIIELYEQNK